MERSRVLLWILVLAMAGVIVWRVGFYTSDASFVPDLNNRAEAAPAQPGTADPNEPSEANTPDVQAPNDGDDPNESEAVSGEGEPNEPTGDAAPGMSPGASAPNESAAADPRAMRRDSRPERSMRPGGPDPDEASGTAETADEPNEPNEPMEAVNLKNVEMKKIIEKIATWTGKTVIPHEEAEKVKITIYAPEKLPREKALSKIYSALRMKGFVVEEMDDTIFLKPIADAKLGTVPMVAANEPLAMFENKDQIVRKFFTLQHYPISQMTEVVKPLVADYGYVGADETTGSLLVIDTVRNLMSIERIIEQFDVPGAGQTVEEFIDVENGDPSEIVQLLRMLLGESPTSGGRNNRSYNRGRTMPSRGRPSNRGGSSEGASSVLISTGDIPIVLIPVPKAKWIIARGSADDVKQIVQWVKKLDRSEPVASESEMVAISYASVREVAMRIEEALQDMPGQELRPSILVQPLEESRQIMIVGRPDLRDMVKKWIAEIDVPTGIFETRVFDLKYADPEQIKENIESLYGDDMSSNRYPYYGYSSYGRRGRGQDSETVKVIEFNTMGQVTVIASPENMRKIEKQIQEWDVPLDVDAVKPRIIELQNSDPVKMADLLTSLFSEDDNGSSSNILRMILGDMGSQRKKIVGPLYGQLTFENVPGTKKIIVISKIPEAYEVIEQLIYELDRQEMAEIPNVVQLQYADPEDLSERLNAMFSGPGMTAKIRRTPRGLQEYTTDDRQEGQNRNTNNNNGNQNGQNPDEYTPPWSGGNARLDQDQEPISNVIGQVRFVPDPRSKSILVLAPPEFQENIAKTIQMLDTPGKQVMVKAVIVEVDHRDLTSLGVRLSSNPTEVFGDMDENAVTALTSLTLLEERGSGTIAVGTDITSMVNFLVKTVNAKILNQQTLWTQDNEEAMLFKGDRVAFQTNFSVSEQGGRVTTNFEFQDVGMTLAVRPSITPDKNVDMMLTVLLSQLTGDTVNGQPLRRVMETTTNMIVDDGQTLMLGGILFQTDSNTQRKVPILGDLPLVGPVFRDYDVSKVNNEMIVFITPFVIDDGEGLSESTAAQIEEPKQKLESIKKDLNQVSEKLEQKLEKK